MSLALRLPAAMEPYREQLLATRQTFVRAKAESARALKPWASKVGGLPYWPKSDNWPHTPDGKPLFFLAQINFAELPADYTGPLPKTGIVQFFILNDDLYGMDFDDGEVQDTFRVVYHPKITENEAVLLHKQPDWEDEEDLLPHHPEESHPLVFTLEEEVAAMTDYRFYGVFGADFFQQFGAEEWAVMDEFGKSVRPQGHKLGGYAYFTQDDPRRKEDPMFLLFQLDSDEGMDLMWGDMGVGHFFIREGDLARLDFSRVLYDWDCL